MEVKILMLIICWNILHPIISRLFGLKNKGALFCGLVGFCADHKGDPGILRLLLMYNLERGEDSTGWAINNEVTKDVVDVKKFLSKNKLELLDEHDNFTFIAHARRSSSGGKWSKDLAHPFGIYKDGTEKAKYDLILAMNGTLTNTAEIAKEFDVPYVSTTNSDTQILARIMAKLGEKEFIKALQSYDGAATLLFFTPKYSNTLMIYKDAARPLFYWQRAKNEMYISSMDDSLFAVGANIEDVHHFEDDTVYRITKGRITKETKVVRTPIKKEIKVYKTKEYDDYGYGGGNQQGKIFHSDNNSNTDLFRNSLINSKPKTGNNVYCLIDRYYRNGHPINGSLLLNDEGKEYAAKDNDDVTKFKRYYFVNGNMLKDEESYSALKVLCPNGSANDVDLVRFKDMKMSVLCEYYAYPPVAIVDEDQKFLLNSIWKEKVRAIGDKFIYCMPFTSINMEVIWQGKCIEVEDDNKTKQIVRVCDIKSVKPKEGSAEDRTANFNEDVKEYLKTYPSISTIGLCERILIKWKVNNTPNVKELFFKKLLDLLLEEKILGKETSYADLLRAGKECFFNTEDKEFSEEVGRCISLLREKFEGGIVGTVHQLTSIIGKHVSKKDLNDDDVEDETQITSVIKTLETRNAFYLQKNFRDELYEAGYDDLNLFAKEWTTSDRLDPDLRVFCEAIILGLHTIGKINEEETIKLIELTDKELQEQTELKYNSYRKDITTSDEGVSEATIPNEAVIPDTWNIQDYEEDAINRYCDIKDQIAEEIKEMEIVPNDERSEKFSLILDFYIATYSQMVSKKVVDEQ